MLTLVYNLVCLVCVTCQCHKTGEYIVCKSCSEHQMALLVLAGNLTVSDIFNIECVSISRNFRQNLILAV